MVFAWLFYLSFSLYFLTMTSQEIICPVNSIYQFGDATSDTGNLIQGTRIFIGQLFPAAHLPYGETFPGKPPGRWSDGRLIIDYIAEYLGFPLLDPYMHNGNASFQNGVNFAVAGAIALYSSFLASKGIAIPSVATTTLSGQLNWFRHYLVDHLCSTPTECSDKLKKALFILGEIGSGDIYYGLIQNKTIEEIQAYVPLIPEAIANLTREIIRGGGEYIVIPGTFPLGCFPSILNLFPNGTKDDQGCLRRINDLSKCLNALVIKALISLKLKFPQANIIYADYYSAFESILRHGTALGFDKSSLLKPCCGVGVPYNFGLDTKNCCGSQGVPFCPNPARYIHWDGIHLTQEANRRISEYLIPYIIKKLNCSTNS